jgi:peptidoglycan hydrolase-like protein with peptidoglycan-binding domain
MSTVLRQGTHGAEVQHLQQLLHQHGYYGGAIDGDFGWRTHVAVTKYQTDAGLHADGTVGDDTWRSLGGTSGSQTGLRADEHVDDYVHSAYGTMHSSMQPHDRLDQLMHAAIQELTELGVPRPTYDFDNALSGTTTMAAFRSTNQWHVAVNPDQFQPAYVERLTEQQLGDVANTIYHESRHAELTFREARAQAGLGQSAAQLVASMHIPQHIADEAVAHAIRQSTVDGGTDEALTGYDSFYGTGQATTQGVYQHGAYEDYRRLPEEADAFETGRNVADHWRHFGGVRGTVRHGDHGDDVSYLQRALVHLGYYQHGADSEGDFGHHTVAAVEQFQGHYSLHADGVCGEQTWEALARVYSE